MRALVALAILLASVPSLACHSDFDCGFGNQCLKPAGSYGAGMCMVSVNQYGNQTFEYRKQQYKAQEVERCSWDTDCAYGEYCVKRSNDLYGVCVR